MSSIFDTNARADEAVFGGEPATRAVGLPTTVGLPGTLAPGGSNATAQGLLQQMQTRTQALMDEAPAQPAREPVVGYNPQDNTVFSGGKTFKLDLNEGRQNEALLDTDNTDLPQGYLPVRSSQVKARLAREYDDLDIIDDSQRAFGQMASGVGSALRDVGADNVGPALEQFGGDIARRNPSKISSFQDIVDSPLVTAGEAVGETGFEVGRYATLGAAGTAIGTGIGVGLTAATGGAAAPTIPVFAFLGNRVANWIPTFAQTYGGIRAEQREAGIDNKERAAGAALGSSALDFLLGPEMRVARAIGGPLTRAAVGKVDNIAQARDFLAKGAPAGTASYGRNAAVDLGGEFGTEIAQTGLERYGAEKDLTSEDALNEYAVAGVKGGIGGVALSPVGTAAENRREIAEKMPEYQQAKNFVENLRADMEMAADPGAPSADRMRAAKRAQDVLRGSSDDPEFDAVLQEFKQKLSFVDTQIVAGATRDALDTNAPVNLMETRPAFFERGAEQVQTTAPSDLSAYEAPALMGREPRAPQQVDTGAPVQQVETLQPMGPFITPGQRTVAGFPALNETMDQIQSGQIAREGLPVTGELTPGQQAALVTPTPLDPIRRALRGVSLDLDQPATTDTIEPVSKVVGAPATLTPSAPAAEGAFSAAAPLQQVETLPQSQRRQAPQAADVAAELAKLDNESIEDPLNAEVEGQIPRVTGRATLTPRSVSNIAALLYNPNEQTTGAASPQEQKIAAAVREFAEAADSEGVLISNVKRGKGVGARQQAARTRAALTRLGKVVGNAKDVEAIVRAVKDAVQRELITDQTRPDLARNFTKLDAMLSSAWNNAKAGRYQGKTDVLAVSASPIKQSKESAAAGNENTIARVLRKGWLLFQGHPEDAERSARAAADAHAKKTKTAYKTEVRSQGKIYFSEKDNTLYLRSEESLDEGRGILGLLNYIRQSGSTVSPFQTLLANALHTTLYATDTAPTVVTIEKGAASYDPKTNTIYIRAEESPEVILHEVLHSALQWFVYQNPDNAAVQQLKESLKAVVAYNGNLGKDAKRVQDILKNLVKKGNELDAVLELVSYGNTLAEFRRAMEAMPSKGTPKSFMENVKALWNSIITTVANLLGSNKSLATDVIEATFKLLQDASMSRVKTRQGNVLEAAVTSSDPEPASEPTDVAKGTDEQAAKSAGYPSFEAYASQPSSKYNITRLFFERIGFGVDKDGNYNAAGRKAQELAGKASLIIRRNFPMLERVILNINSKFGLPPAMQRIMEYFKSNQNTGILEMEKLTEYVHRNPAVARPMLDYLDGNAKALDGVKDAEAIRAIADNVRMHLETYINDLPANSPERALFQNLKFTEYLLHPKSVAQLANKSFGLKKLSTLLTIKRREETNIDAFMALLPMKDGVVDSEAPLYQTFQTIQDNNGMNQRVPMGFIDKKLADTNPPADLDIEKSRVWKMAGRKGDRYSFVSRAVTPGEVRRMAEDGRVEELSATLLNTMAALSHNYASRNFFAGLLPLGREDGEPTAMSVVFDSEEQLRKIFKGGVPNEIIDAGNDAIDMQSIKADLQRTGTWVRLPEGPTYGALAGKIISGPAWSAMRDMHDRAPLLNSQALATTMSWFKKAKTGYTPATHVNNILTNYSMTLLHGISHKTLLDAAKLFAKFEAAPKSLKPRELAMVQAFYRSGAVLGQYTQTEAKQTIAKALSASISPDPGGSLLTKINQLAKFEKEFAQLVIQAGRMGRNADARVMELYAAGDNIFRLAAFMNVSGNLQARDGTDSLTPAQTTEAGIAARKMFLDYDIDARWVRAARQSVLPFVSWSYAIMPVLGRLAITRPWAMVNMLTAIAVMNSIMDDEDDEEWRKKGPEAVRDKALWGMGPHMYMRVPFLGDDENPVYWNIGKSIPMMALFQPPAGESKLLGQGWYPGFLNPSGPYVSLLANTFLNIDPFTGKELYKETDTNTAKLVNSTKAVWDVMMPSWASTRLATNLQDLADGKVGPTGVLPDSMFIARLFGMTLYEFNRSEVQYSQNAEVNALKREFMTAMRAAAKDEARRGYPDHEALDVKLADLRERMMQAMANAKGEE